MNNAFQTARVGLFFVLGLALIYVVHSVIGDRRLRAQQGYEVVAVFPDIKTLARGADVRMAGVRIGEVDATRLVDGQGLIVLRINPEITIPDDSVARIAVASLLGQNYITVSYGTSNRMLTAGETIRIEATADLNQIMTQIGSFGEKLNALADNFSGFGGEDLGKLMTNLNALVESNRQAVDRVITNLDTITSALAGTEGTLGKLINEDGAYQELMATVTEIRGAASDARATIGNAQGVFARLEQGEGTLGKLLYDDSMASELQSLVANLREFSEKLNSNEGTLGKLLSDDALYRDLQGMLSKADRAMNSVSDSGPITAVGVISSALF
jgi:phospholipid/cholesterol/gamma-HCH transport system substrate-binding protein